jgi:hypothetical protein
MGACRCAHCAELCATKGRDGISNLFWIAFYRVLSLMACARRYKNASHTLKHDAFHAGFFWHDDSVKFLE